MAHLEQAVIDSFNRFFEREARQCGRRVRSFSLGGQDALVGADYVLTDQSQFSLIEFKYTQDEIGTESKKHRRLKLCAELEANAAMLDLHDKCHFVAWAEKPKMIARCNVYRLEVCNQEIFGASCGLSNAAPMIAERIYAKQFTTEFFSNLPPRSLNIHDFERYLAWLLKTASGSTKSSLQLLTFDELSEECAMVQLESIKAAYDWMQRNSPQPPHQPPSFAY